MWRWATFHLYALPATSIAAFTSITTNSLYVIGALVVFFVTGRLVYEWKNQTASEVIEQAQSFVSDSKEEVTEHILTMEEQLGKYGDIVQE